ncbi:MAG TPA: hypothetical protein VNT75_15595 [Symbiobacteriaceae bacterium]|nr:hypothetical protein [Symbiobacteriaceae bacterium]
MRRAAALLLAVALLALSGCGPARPKTVPAGVSSTTLNQEIEVKASIATATFAAGSVPTVDVEVRNTGKTAVRYVRFDGCDRGFQVRMQPGGGLFALRTDSPVRGCTAAIEFADLQPGESVKASYVYRPAATQPPLTVGEHTISVSFNRGTAPDQLNPVVVTLKVNVTSQ